MLRYLSLAAFGVLLLAGVLISGCAQRQQRVAGTQEQATTVTATITSTGLQLSPSQALPGNITLQVKNQTNVAHVVTVQGPNSINKSTKSVQPGQTVTLSLPTLKNGSYSIFVKGMQTQPAMAKTLTVTSTPKPTPTTTTGAAAQVVTATVTASGLQLSKEKINAGNLTLHVKNSSNKAETVVLSGPNSYMKNIGPVQPGQTKSLNLVAVPAGAYSVYVKGMQNKAAMKKTLTIGAAGKVAGTTEQAGTVNVTLSDTNKFTFTPASVTATSITLDFKNTSGHDVTFMDRGQTSTVRHNATTQLLTMRRTAANQWEITRPTAGMAAISTTPSAATGAAKTVTISQNGDKFTISPEYVTGNDILIVFRNMGKQNAMYTENGKTSTVKPNARMTLVMLRKTGTNQWEVTTPSGMMSTSGTKSTGTGTGTKPKSGSGYGAK